MNDNHAHFNRAFHFSAAAVFIALIVIVAATPAAQAQTYTLTVLYSFTGGADGGAPAGTPVLDSRGNLYGTTMGGGDLTCSATYSGCGTVFRVSSTGNEQVLYNFKGIPDGSEPDWIRLAHHASNLYGTTMYGGANDTGAVFQLNPKTGQETILYSFAGGTDGAIPHAGVIRDAAGNLYGTTYLGGSGFYGTVFKLEPTGTETVLHNFTSGADGGLPTAGLLGDGRGNLYGTTEEGGQFGYGTVFKLDPTGKLTVLHSFAGVPDGADPKGALVKDRNGNLYGTTFNGGTYDYGTVFRLNLKTRELNVLHSFTGGTDGQGPTAELLLDMAGNLYGTTVYGGTYGVGTVFKLDIAGECTVLHSFALSEGTFPEGGLVSDGAGNLYGTTSFTVFKLTPN